MERREVRRRKRAILLQLETRKEGRLSCCEKNRSSCIGQEGQRQRQNMPGAGVWCKPEVWGLRPAKQGEGSSQPLHRKALLLGGL